MTGHYWPRKATNASERGGIISRFLFLCCFIAFLLVLWVVRHPILRFAGEALVTNESPRASDAIAVLGDDNYNGDRASRAAELLKAGWAPRVVASGRYLRPYVSIADLEQHDLRDRGVPASAIVRFPHRAADTREECAALSQLFAQHGWKQVMIVTSSYHTRRAEYICSRLLQPRTELRVIAAPDYEYQPDSWWETRQGIKIYFHEILGFAVAIWEMRHNSVQATSASLLGMAPEAQRHRENPEGLEPVGRKRAPSPENRICWAHETASSGWVTASGDVVASANTRRRCLGLLPDSSVL